MIRREFITLLGGAARLAARGARAAAGDDAESRHSRGHSKIITAVGSLRATHG